MDPAPTRRRRDFIEAATASAASMIISNAVTKGTTYPTQRRLCGKQVELPNDWLGSPGVPPRANLAAAKPSPNLSFRTADRRE
jgi:hypothetical protein